MNVKVKIIKANKKTYWYRDLIGKVFDAYEYENKYGCTGYREGFLIDKDDCEVQ